jgi:predicted alpha-1,6-mannanase (GH76 family)
MPPSLPETAAGAVRALQAWYEADAYAKSTGLYHWDDPDLSVELGGGAAASAIVALGYRNAAQDTLRWWNSANAITALIDYMSITGDSTYAWVIDETFTKATQAWQPKVGAITGWTLVGAGAGAAWGLALAGPVGAVVGFVFGLFTGAKASTGTSLGRTYLTDFLDRFYDDEGWWALAWLKAYDFTGNQKYLDMSVKIFSDMTGGWDTQCRGGIYWQKNHQGPDGKPSYKNAIANELFLAVAAALYVRLVKTTPEWVYFQGTDNRLWRVFSDGGQQLQIGDNKTSSTPFVTADGWVYFRGTDDKLWKVFNDGTQQTQIGANKTSSTPFVTADGWVYFQGTDDKLWKVFNDGTQRTQIGGNKTSSAPFVTADGWVFFRGTDNKLWKVFNDGSSQSQVGSNTTSSTPVATADGWVYFRGTDNKLWKVFNDGTQESQIGDNTTASTPCVSAAGPAPFESFRDWAVNKAWPWFSASGLISNSLVSDSFSESDSAWTCSNRLTTDVWSYNQGVILGALCDLYEITGDRNFLEQAETLATTFIANPYLTGKPSSSGINGDGILTEFTDDNSSYAAVRVDCRQFKGIFVRNLARLWSAAGHPPRYRAFILRNAASAIANMSAAFQFGASWSAPFDSADFIRQTAAVDLLNAALLVRGRVDLSYLTPLLLESESRGGDLSYLAPLLLGD